MVKIKNFCFNITFFFFFFHILGSLESDLIVLRWVSDVEKENNEFIFCYYPYIDSLQSNKIQFEGKQIMQMPFDPYTTLEEGYVVVQYLRRKRFYITEENNFPLCGDFEVLAQTNQIWVSYE